jgi:hypothetical protein
MEKITGRVRPTFAVDDSSLRIPFRWGREGERERERDTMRWRDAPRVIDC